MKKGFKIAENMNDLSFSKGRLHDNEVNVPKDYKKKNTF